MLDDPPSPVNAATHRRAVDLYLSEIAATPLLDAAGELDLGLRVAGGDAVARDLLVRANLRLVVALARDFRGRGVAWEDLVAEGNLGLIRAAESFDPGYGSRFATYASYWIKQLMRMAVMRHGEAVRLPQYMVTLLAKWRRTSARLSVSLGREATQVEVAAALGVSSRRAEYALAALAVKAAMPRQAEDAETAPELAESVIDGSASAGDLAVMAEDVGAVGFAGFQADGEGGGDFLAAAAFGDELHDFALAGGERGGLARRGFKEAFAGERRNLGGEKGFAGGERGHGGDERGAGIGFEEVAARAGGQGFPG